MCTPRSGANAPHDLRDVEPDRELNHYLENCRMENTCFNPIPIASKQRKQSK
jgi:hypothetical protein